MSPLDAARDRYVARFEAREGPGDAPWLDALRRRAIEAFAARGLPSRREEEWRYTNVAALAAIPFELPGPGRAPVTREAVEELSIPVFACSLFVFVDGRYAPELSAPSLLSGEVSVESLARLRTGEPDALRAHLGTRVDLKQHPFAALNTAFLDDGAVLRVPEGAQLDRPLHVVFVDSGAAAPVVQHPRVLVVAEAGSRATLIQDHVSLGGATGFTNAVTEIEVGPNARVDFALLQRESGERYHVSNVQTRVRRDGRLRSWALTLGGKLVRNDLGARLDEEGADCELEGLFLGDGDQLIDNHTLVDHAMPHGSSRQLYKGLLADRARGVFRGRVQVRPGAQKTNARQSNPNLILSDTAEIDTKPQLEIHADDVRCSHGSSIGQVDADALFYLRSRGVAEREARDLLARGFACEVTASLPVEPLREEIDQLVLDKLSRRVPAQETP